MRPASSTTSTPSSMVLNRVSRKLRSRARRCTTVCTPSASRRLKRPRTLSRKLDLLAMGGSRGEGGGWRVEGRERKERRHDRGIFAARKRQQAGRTPYAGARFIVPKQREAYGVRPACWRFEQLVRHYL